MDTDGTFYVSIGYTRDIRVEMSLQQAAMDGTGMPGIACRTTGRMSKNIP